MELRRGSENLNEMQEVNRWIETTDQKNGVDEGNRSRKKMTEK